MGPEGEHDWEEKPHHLSLLVGGTFEEEESAPTLGVDYEYRVDEFLGVGAVVAERAFDEIEATTYLGVADLHFNNGVIVQTGPGIEIRDGEDDIFVYRLGVLYEWEWGGYTVSPQLHYDATSEQDAIIVGVAFGFAF